MCLFVVFFSSRRRHTRVALVTGVQTCALPIAEGDETVDDAPQVFRLRQGGLDLLVLHQGSRQIGEHRLAVADRAVETPAVETVTHLLRSEEHTSELQSLMRISYAVFCLKKKKKIINPNT